MRSPAKSAVAGPFVAAVIAFAAHADAQENPLSLFGGEWLYVEDRTEGRPVEKQQPPMSVTFGLRVENDVVVMLRGKGASRREERITLDGTVLKKPGRGSTTHAKGVRKDGGFDYEVEIVRDADGQRVALIRRQFRMTPDGLQVRVMVGDPASMDSVALYRHPVDIPLPTPAKGRVADLPWLAGAWHGKRRTSSLEERWSPPRGGALLGVSRTVKNGRMVRFEYLRIVERDGGLVYVAQPGGRPPTEFVLTELSETRAVFENPRHDSPQRIVYELAADGRLSASIGFVNGGKPTVFEFTRGD